MALTLLRHTCPDVAPGICYGMSDLALADSFTTEANALLATLPPIDRIVTSPLSRCRLLADHIARWAGYPVNVDNRLQEMDFGRWEGQAWADIPRTEIDAWVADFMHARPHGGESVAMLRARTLEAVEHYRQLAGHTLIVTHAGVIKAALAADETTASHAAGIGFGCFVTLIDRKDRHDD